MPLSTSNFKRILRLPRLFFRTPTAQESVHGGPPLEFERPIPVLPWRGITVVVVLVVIGASIAWEFYCRSLGYGPTLNDNEDLWTLRRRSVTPESVVIIGDSRGWYDLDLDELQKGLGKRPVQLAIRSWRTWPRTRAFTGRSSAASCRDCFLRLPVRLRWNAVEKPCDAFTAKLRPNAQASTWPCRWKSAWRLL